jgi:hypothetical protein
MLFIINSIIGLFKILITVLFFFLLLRWISTLSAPKNPASSKGASSNNHRNAGETIVKINNPKNKTSSPVKGEYVDFEEID